MRAMLTKTFAVVLFCCAFVTLDRPAEAGMMRCIDYNNACLAQGCQPNYGGCNQYYCEVWCQPCGGYAMCV